jgi:hypothetical protein
MVLQNKCDEEMHSLKTQVAGLERFMNESGIEMRVVKEGVANFREFQQDARDYFTEAKTRALENEKHTNRRDQEIKDTLADHNRKISIWIAVITVIIGFLELVHLYRGH